MASKPTKVVLGIDFGSTSLRAALLKLGFPDGHGWHPITNPVPRGSNFTLGDGEWPITLYPMDETADRPRERIWQNFGIDQEQTRIPAKYAMIYLANKINLRDQYCVVDPLFDYKFREKLRSNLETGLRELFQDLKDQVMKECSINKFEIDRVALSVPVQWLDNTCQDVYHQIVSEVFSDIDKSRIDIITEIEAVAHFVFTEKNLTLMAKMESTQSQPILYIDSGGHAMSYCTFHVVYDRDNKTPTFHLVGNPGGYGGGSEQWAYKILQACIFIVKRHKDRGGRDVPQSVIKQLEDQINRKKRDSLSTLDENGWDMPIIEGKKAYFIQLLKKKIMAAFYAAFGGLLAQAREAMKELARDGNGLVVVSGGSSLHDSVQDEIRHIHREVGLPGEPIFMETDARYDFGLKVAKGAAYAFGQRITARDFMKQAAFGLQKLVTLGDDTTFGHNGDVMITEDQRRVQYTFKSSGYSNTQYRIICDPFYARRQGSSVMQPELCYDVAILGCVRKGQWTLDLCLVDSEDDLSSEDHEYLDRLQGVDPECAGMQHSELIQSRLFIKIKILHKGRRLKYEKEGVQHVRHSVLDEIIITERNKCAFLKTEEKVKGSLRPVFEREGESRATVSPVAGNTEMPAPASEVALDFHDDVRVADTALEAQPPTMPIPDAPVEDTPSQVQHNTNAAQPMDIVTTQHYVDLTSEEGEADDVLQETLHQQLQQEISNNSFDTRPDQVFTAWNLQGHAEQHFSIASSSIPTPPTQEMYQLDIEHPATDAIPCAVPAQHPPEVVEALQQSPTPPPTAPAPDLPVVPEPHMDAYPPLLVVPSLEHYNYTFEVVPLELTSTMPAPASSTSPAPQAPTDHTHTPEVVPQAAVPTPQAPVSPTAQTTLAMPPPAALTAAGVMTAALVATGPPPSLEKQPTSSETRKRKLPHNFAIRTPGPPVNRPIVAAAIEMAAPPPPLPPSPPKGPQPAHAGPPRTNVWPVDGPDTRFPKRVKRQQVNPMLPMKHN